MMLWGMQHPPHVALSITLYIYSLSLNRNPQNLKHWLVPTNVVNVCCLLVVCMLLITILGFIGLFYSK